MSQTAVAQISPFEVRFGHPPGLFVLFFAEMWERFSYYGMRALLVFYMTKGFLGYGDDRAYGVYSAYTSLVYMTPFFGGMIADRLLGARRSVVIGGLLMAAGHLLMTVQNAYTFFVALALLICGNGFFKPNISTIVGSLYGEGDTRRDGGFTLFYMGINLGAALAPLVCGYVGETYGWHYGFGLATIGMLVGLAVFVAPRLVTQLMIMGTAVVTAAGMVATQLGDPLMLAVNAPVAVALVVAAIVAWMALDSGGLPDLAGAASDGAAKDRQVVPGLSSTNAVYLGILLAIPVIAFLVSDVKAAEYLLDAVGALAVGYLLWESFRATPLERGRIWVILVLMFFSMLFWAFFELAGSALNNFTDRNVDRAVGHPVIVSTDVGTTMEIPFTQEQLGYSFPRSLVRVDALDAAASADGAVVMTIDRLDKLGKEGGKAARLQVPITQEMVGMGIAETATPASVFQAANPIFILIFGLVFTAMWGWLGRAGREPSTPVKFGFGLLQLGLGFGALWYGTQVADGRGMVGMEWLVLAYLLHTTGELCLSPVGLAMVTRLSPARLVSTAMGAWFLATAFSQLVSGFIAKMTSVGGEGGEEGMIPPPIDTLHVYGDVFAYVGVVALGSAVVVWVLSPLLVRWAAEEPGAETRGAH